MSISVKRKSKEVTTNHRGNGFGIHGIKVKWNTLTKDAALFTTQIFYKNTQNSIEPSGVDYVQYEGKEYLYLYSRIQLSRHTN